MWSGYLYVLIKDLRRQKFAATINAVGMALGLALFWMISLYVYDEYSWDSGWQRSERIVRLVQEVETPRGTVRFSNASVLAAPLLQDSFTTEIEAAARMWPRGSRIRVGDKSFQNLLFLADRSVLDVFDFDVREGSLEYALAEPNRLALSEATAARLFGGAPALGKRVLLEREGMSDIPYEVAAVYRIPEGNGALHWQFDNFSLLDENAAPELTRQPGNWGGETRSYFLMRDGVDVRALNARLDQLVDEHVQAPMPVPEGGNTSDVFRYRLQHITDIHFDPNTDEAGSSKSSVNALGGIAAFVLAISLSNFIILNLARYVERQREVAVRKVTGAVTSELLKQFVGESLLLAVISGGMAIVLVEMFLPALGTMLETELTLALGSTSMWSAFAGLVLGVGVVGGLYPASVLSRQRPDHALRPDAQTQLLGTRHLRFLLVGFQFLIASGLTIATLILYFQLSYMRGRDVGFNSENVVAVALGQVDAASKVAALRNRISAIPGVQMTALASHTANSASGGLFSADYSHEGLQASIDFYQVDYDFFAVYDMQLLAGRFYNEGDDSVRHSQLLVMANPRLDGLRSAGGRLIINESLSRALGLATAQDAIGKTIYTSAGAGEVNADEVVEVIGVVADNQFRSLRLPVGNTAYYLQTAASWYLTLKIDPSIQSTIRAELGRAWDDVIGFGQAQIEFVENNVQGIFDRELREGRLLLGASTLAVIIAWFGLYGLVSFETRRRTKEIGMRTVLGATFRSVFRLFLGQFGRPILWGYVFAWPLALGGMLFWIEKFPYQITLPWMLLLCIAAGALLGLVVISTLGFTVGSAVRARPVRALRYE